MFAVSSEATAVIAQIVAVLVFASVVRARQAFAAGKGKGWPWRLGSGLSLAVAVVLSGGVLLQLLLYTAEGGATVDSFASIEHWIMLQFLVPVGVLLYAELMLSVGRSLGGVNRRAGPP